MNSLNISTANAKTDTNSFLHYRFKNPLLMDGYIALSNINLWYNWPNITDANNTLSYKKGDGAEIPITLPRGSYSVEDLNNYLHFVMKQNSHIEGDADEPSFGINLYENPVYNRVTLTVKDGYAITFQEGLAKTLGAPQDSRTFDAGQNNFPFVPKIENVQSVQVHCSLVSNQHQADSSLLYNFTPDGQYGTLLSIEPRFAQWRHTRIATESEIDVWLTDQDGKVLQLEDSWSVTLQLVAKDLIKLI